VRPQHVGRRELGEAVRIRAVAEILDQDRQPVAVHFQHDEFGRIKIGVQVHDDAGDLAGERAVHKAFTLIAQAAARPWVAAGRLGLCPRLPLRKVEHRLGNRLRRGEQAEPDQISA
jgi:hypothetical protein